MANEFKIRTGLVIGNPTISQPVQIITNSSDWGNLDVIDSSALATVEAIKNYMSSHGTTGNYLPISGGTLTGNLEIKKDNPILSLNDSSGTNQGKYSFSLDNGILNLSSFDESNNLISNILKLNNNSLTLESSTSGWYINNNRILTSASEGSGNGLNVDKVDGLDASAFLRNDVDNSINGNIIWKAGKRGGWADIPGEPALDLANGDILGLNTLLFNDLADGVDEGIIFPVKNGPGANKEDYSGLRGDENRNLLWTPDLSVGTSYIVYHTGNNQHLSRLVNIMTGTSSTSTHWYKIATIDIGYQYQDFKVKLAYLQGGESSGRLLDGYISFSVKQQAPMASLPNIKLEHYYRGSTDLGIGYKIAENSSAHTKVELWAKRTLTYSNTYFQEIIRTEPSSSGFEFKYNKDGLVFSDPTNINYIPAWRIFDAGDNQWVFDGSTATNYIVHIKQESILGGSGGNYKEILKLSGRVSNMHVYERTWYNRKVAGTTTTNTEIVNGLGIGTSYSTPATAKTWWKRDPGTSDQKWGTGGTTQIYLTGDGSLGLGNTNTKPKARFTIQNLSSSDNISALEFSEGVNSNTFSFRSDFLGTGDYNKLRLASNWNSNVMTWMAGGKVGIGTNDPSSKLHIYGGEQIIESTAGGDILTLKYPVGQSGIIRGKRETQNYWYIGNGSSDPSLLTIVNEASGDILWYTNGASRMYLTKSGKLALGSNFKDPSAYIHIKSTSTSSNWKDGGSILLERTQTNTETAIVYKSPDTSTNYWFHGLNQDYDFQFAYGNEFADNKNRVTFKASGNVGIGTVSPAVKLDVIGKERIREELEVKNSSGAEGFKMQWNDTDKSIDFIIN